MKGCLKSPAPVPCSSQTRKCKCVAFCAEGSEEVYPADVWDRTPAEPARQLSYQDLLELKEIQCSLPRANQQADPISGRPASQFLSGVPIGLLPLLPEAPATPTCTPSPPSQWTSSQWTPPSLSHLQPRAPPVRPKPRFSFLPLLDSPSTCPSPPPSPTGKSPSSSSSDYQSDASSLDPPTPTLTNASIDSSPQSRASLSPSPEPHLFLLPPPRTLSHPGMLKHHFGPSELDFVSPAPSLYHNANADTPPASPRNRWTKWTPPPPPPLVEEEKRAVEVLGRARPLQRKKRNIIVVNGVEIPLDDDEDDDARSPVRVATPTMPMGALALSASPPGSASASRTPAASPRRAPPSPAHARAPPPPPPIPVPSRASPAPPSPPTPKHAPPGKPPPPPASPARTPSPRITRATSPPLPPTCRQQGYMPISFKRDAQRGRGAIM